MARIGIGIDYGTDSLKVVAGREKGGAFQVLQAATIAAAGSDPLVELGALLSQWGVKGEAVLGVTGKDMIIRYTQLPLMPDWRLQQVMGFEIADLAMQSGGDLSADFNRLDIANSLSEDDTILLTLIKNSLIEEHSAALKGSKVSVGAFTPNAIALYNVMMKSGEADSGTVMAVNIGAESMDIAIAQEGSLIFARNVSGGSSIFDAALIEAFGFSPAKAQKLKKTIGRILVRDDAAGLKPQEEKLARSLSGAAGRVYSMIRSSLMFCKAQIKVADLEIGRLLLTGGGARLRGLPEYLADNLGVEVSLLDPTPNVDLSHLDDPETFGTNGLELSTATGLAMMPVFDDVYSIAVLPEEVKKKRRFYNQTVYSILAGALLVIFLGVSFYLARKDYDVLHRSRSRIVTELRQRQSRTSDALALHEQNQNMVRKLGDLEQRIVAGTGLARTLRLVQENLPQDLWVSSISLDRVQNEELNRDREKRVVVRVEGGGRESGRPLQQSFTEFTQRLSEDPLVHGLVPQASQDVASDFSFLLQISFTAFPESQGDEEEDIEDQAGGVDTRRLHSHPGSGQRQEG